MAIKDLGKRLERMERRFIVQPRHVVPESHAELARDLHLARDILSAEREAARLIEQIDDAGHIQGPGSRAQRSDARDACLREREAKVADLERHCAEAGLTEDDIARFAS
jgi:hypothetical protein